MPNNKNILKYRGFNIEKKYKTEEANRYRGPGETSVEVNHPSLKEGACVVTHR